MKKQYSHKKMLAILTTLLLFLAIFSSCGSANWPASNTGENEEHTALQSTIDSMDVPPEISRIRDKVTTLVANEALLLSGEFADWHKAMVQSEEKREYTDYDEHLKVLKSFQDEIGATYVYTLFADDGDAKEFLIALDASDHPDDFAQPYDWEIQFKEAWEGNPSSARSAWSDGEEDFCWSAFAPIYDSSGEVVALLGVDYPAPEIASFPEWNRDDPNWNHIEK